MSQKSVCVFCASSSLLDLEYVQAAEQLGFWLADQKYNLVYGGGNVGLMGVLAQAVHQRQGKVIGVIPELLHQKGYSYTGADELIITPDMRDRKTVMEKRSDLFLALPGGFGTLEEILEILTLKQLQYHSKPICLVNIKNFYDPLLLFFEKMIQQKFANEKHKNLYHLVNSLEEAQAYIQSQI